MMVRILTQDVVYSKAADIIIKRGTMEINYQETTSDLLKRIDIHEIYGGRDIDRKGIIRICHGKSNIILR
jgi:hypothetical protein